MRKKLIVIFLLFGSVSTVLGADSTEVDTIVKTDTILYVPQELGNIALGVTDTSDYEKHLYQNPTTALFKSMLVPGLGQVGNRQYVKAGVIIGLQTWLIGSAIKHGNDASDWRKQFEASSVVAERNELYENYLGSKDQRNKFTWFAAIVTFASMFDAFSDAHLSGFPKESNSSSQEINLTILPSEDSGVNATVSFSF